MQATMGHHVGTRRRHCPRGVFCHANSAILRVAHQSLLKLGSGRRRTMNPIYLDYNATTPLDPAVIDAMLPYLREHFGNPSSTHILGKTAHNAVEQARQQVAQLMGAQPDEIVFTGGGTEASNLALKGSVFARQPNSAHIIISAIEHPA